MEKVTDRRIDRSRGGSQLRTNTVVPSACLRRSLVSRMQGQRGGRAGEKPEHHWHTRRVEPCAMTWSGDSNAGI